MHLHPKRRRDAAKPGIEPLETRALLSGVPLGTLAETDPADTLDQAFELGILTAEQVSGSIDQSGTDVDWFAFTLQFPSTVILNGTGGSFGLYDSAMLSLNDPLGSVGYRLLVQATGSGDSTATVTRMLDAGTYYVAVSGAGNELFHPLIANSGLAGTPGEYSFDLVATPLETSSFPEVIALTVDASALGFRIDLTEALDFAPTVQLWNSAGEIVGVGSIHQNPVTRELIIVPEHALAAGSYRAVVSDGQGHTRLEVEFDVLVGAEGDGGNDTVDTAEDLGDITDSGLVQISGVIGDDPYYHLVTSVAPWYAGNDLDLYHFQIDSTVPVGLQAEVFAGRIGSALDAGLTLYKKDPVTGGLVWVAGNNQSYNSLAVLGGATPLYRDPVLLTGLTSGEYYMAVSHGSNAVSTSESQWPGVGTSDPGTAHSGQLGTNIGRYVLNMQVVPLGDAPEVLAISVADGDQYASSPTDFVVQFNQYMNLISTAFVSYQFVAQSSVPGVFIQAADGSIFYPSLQDFNPETFEARFVMTRRLPPGSYSLHLSGDLGVANLTGAPLQGNSEGGDYVVNFKVRRSEVGTNGNPHLWTHDPRTDGTGEPQSLGVLFPRELQSGVSIARTSRSIGRGSNDTSDEYEFTILQSRTYGLNLNGLNLPPGVKLSLKDSQGNLIDVSDVDDGRTLYARLEAGTYTLIISEWAASQAPGLTYEVTMRLLGLADNAPPLTTGPAPTVGLRLSGLGPITNPPPVGGGLGNENGSRPGSGFRPGSSLSSGGQLTHSSPANLSILGSQRLDLSAGTPSVVIALPTVTSQSGSLGGATFRAARNSRLASGLRETLAPSGLHDLADGPIGRERGLNGLRQEFERNGRSLHALIRNTVDQERELAESPNSHQSNQPPVTETTDASADGAETVTSNEHGTPSDVPVSATREDASMLLDAISMILESHSSGTIDAAASSSTVVPVGWKYEGALIVSAEESALRDVGSSAWAVSDDDGETQVTDKLFAAGLGLLLSDMILPRSAAGHISENQKAVERRKLTAQSHRGKSGS